MSNLFPAVHLLTKSDNCIELKLEISPSIKYFEGHFPNAPVLAGVTQLNWAVHYSKLYFPTLFEVKAVEVLKFQVMIHPNDELTLRLEHTANNTSLFSYFKQETKVASGRLQWTLKNHE